MAEISREIGLDVALARLGVMESEKTSNVANAKHFRASHNIVENVNGELI